MTRNIIAALLLITVAGCASTPKSIPALEQARSELETTRADANAQRYATSTIEEATRQLTAAESAAKDRKDLSTISHLAYLSAQTSKTARELGKAKAGDERIAQASAERERIRLEARTREAEIARSAADQARTEAEQARGDAQQAQAAATEASSQLALEQEKRAQLQKEMEDLMAKRSDRGLVITLGDVLFDTGKAELKSGADRQLNTVAAFLTEHPERRVLIEGFTDSVGADEYNQELSERRASAVRSALATRGVDSSRIETQGYGEQYPIGTNADTGGRQLNRRVEVIVSTGPEPVAPRGRM